MGTCTSHSVAETIALGEAWGREAEAGWLIGLIGDLGAGKTQLVKGLAAGLGIQERVLSPSFALVHEYRGGRLPLFHIDLYRLETAAQIHGAGLEEYLLGRQGWRGVTVVEWFDRYTVPPSAGGGAPVTLGRPFRRVALEALNDHERRIVYEDSGA